MITSYRFINITVYRCYEALDPVGSHRRYGDDWSLVMKLYHNINNSHAWARASMKHTMVSNIDNICYFDHDISYGPRLTHDAAVNLIEDHIHNQFYSGYDGVSVFMWCNITR